MEYITKASVHDHKDSQDHPQNHLTPSAPGPSPRESIANSKGKPREAISNRMATALI